VEGTSIRQDTRQSTQFAQLYRQTTKRQTGDKISCEISRIDEICGSGETLFASSVNIIVLCQPDYWDRNRCTLLERLPRRQIFSIRKHLENTSRPFWSWTNDICFT